VAQPERCKTAADFGEYADRFPAKVQSLPRKMRAAIRKAAPKAQETISYQIPAFTLNGKRFVWFAAFASHIGFYPGAAAIAAFKKELAGYKSAKGSVQFPFDEALPLELVERMVKFAAKKVTSA
jgi:uncharacterized protein YdhG (YjbR/CyaY superfamily)